MRQLSRPDQLFVALDFFILEIYAFFVTAYGSSEGLTYPKIMKITSSLVFFGTYALKNSSVPISPLLPCSTTRTVFGVRRTIRLPSVDCRVDPARFMQWKDHSIIQYSDTKVNKEKKRKIMFKLGHSVFESLWDKDRTVKFAWPVYTPFQTS